MSSWNYRVVKTQIRKGQNIYEIKEVYYDDKGKINGYSDAPVPYGESKKELKKHLKLMKKALKEPVVDYKAIQGKE